MNMIFVDTGAWLALADRRDQYHRAATAVYPQLLRHYTHLLTTNLVIAETYTLIRRRLGFDPSQKFLRSLRTTNRLHFFYPDDSLTQEAEAILQKYPDQNLSMVDAISFATMQQETLTTAFAFDHHFRLMGFDLRGEY